MGGNRHGPIHASCRGARLSDLPIDLLAQVLAHLPLALQLELAPELGSTWAAAAALNIRGVAVDLRLRTRQSVGQRGLTAAVATVSLVSPAAASIAGSAATAAAQAGCWEPEEGRLWHGAPSRLRPAAAAWHLRRAASALGGGAAGRAPPAGPRRSLSLVLAAPEMDTTTSQLRRMLATAGVEGRFESVAMPLGLLRLDGGLNAQLTWANMAAAGLPATLQASAPYTCLERLALKLSPEDDLPALLGCIQPGTLPALCFLALLAPGSAGMAADLSALHHPCLRRLDLRGVQLPAGFSCLQQLTGLEALAVRHDEDEEAPPLNLLGDLSALAPLRQLSFLCLDNLASGEGLPSLPQLTSLSLAPQQGARITLRGLPRLRQLAVDLSAGSCGRDLLSAERSSVHVPPAGHGLVSLTRLELRCFVWRQWEAAGSEAGGDGSESGSDDASGSEAGSGSSSSSSDSSATGSSDSDSSMGDSSSEEEEAEEVEEEEVAASSAGSGGSMGDVEDEDVDEVDEGEAAEAGDQGLEAEEEEEEEAEEGEEEEGEEEGEEEAEEVQAAGLLQATWGFLQQGEAAGGSHNTGAENAGSQQARAMMSLEQRYITGLLSRLPTLAAIQLTDYMGLVDPASLLAAAPAQQQGAKLAAVPTAVGPPPAALAAGGAAAAAAAAMAGNAGKEAGGGGGAGSRAGTPGLVLQQEAGGSASSLAGWQRAVQETPVPGGISQYDVTYRRCGRQ